MQSQFNFVFGYEIARGRQAEIAAEVRQCRAAQQVCQDAAKAALERERRRFFRRYQLRSILFRLAPNWAAKWEL